MRKSTALIGMVFMLFIVIFGILLSTSDFFNQSANIGSESTSKSSKETHAVEKCESGECFWNKVKDCEKAEYVLEERAGNVETKLKLEVLKPEKGGCKISAKLLSMKFLSIEGLDEKVVNSIQRYFDEIAGSDVICKFETSELEKNPFVNSSFVTMESCSGKLKEVMLNLESEIEKRILGE